MNAAHTMNGWTKTEVIAMLAMVGSLGVAVFTIGAAIWKRGRHEAQQDTRIEFLERQMKDLTQKLDEHMRTQNDLLRRFLESKLGE